MILERLYCVAGGKHHRFKRGYKNVIDEGIRLVCLLVPNFNLCCNFIQSFLVLQPKFCPTGGCSTVPKIKIEFLLIYDSDNDDHVMFHTEHNWRGCTLGY